MIVIVGVGASGERARDLVDAGIAGLVAHPLLSVRGQSRRYQNPAWGGATRAPFVNAAVVVETALGPEPLLRACFAIEHSMGRLRMQKNAARTLDLDLLFSPTTTSTSAPVLPHPRFLQRAFAVIPAVQALRAAKRAVPLELQQAEQRHALAPMFAMP